MNETLQYLRTFAQFPLTLRRSLRHKLTLPEARSIINQRLEQRESNFLRLAERSVYGYPASPYLPLLKLAGCQFGDLRSLVKSRGVEGALQELREAGVYVTFEEFKGRKPIIRQGKTITVRASDFDNPCAQRDFQLFTSGSTGLATAVGQDLDYIAAGAPHQMVTLSALGLLDVPSVHWQNMLPGNALRFMLQRAFYGQPFACWYSPQGWRDSKYWIKYDLATVYMVACMRAIGVRVHLPRIARLDQAHLVARSVHELLQEHGHCMLYTGTSRAMRVALAAEQAGWSLEGATSRCGGEPLTAAKAAVIQHSGLRILVGYGMSETGTIGFGCLHPAAPDDVHLFHDAFALIAQPYPVAGSDLVVPAFNLTALLAAAPKVMLNYQVDDCGVIEQRHCGCELEALGFHTHLREIRSYGKLVGEATTLIGNEMLQILEQRLPARFGGSALDYQLVEQEDVGGFTRLYLNISPRVVLGDEHEVVRFVSQELGKSSPTGDATRLMWQQAQTIRVRRQEPIPGRSGKLFPLHIDRSTKAKKNER
jgi:hypothetical protein